MYLYNSLRPRITLKIFSNLQIFVSEKSRSFQWFIGYDTDDNLSNIQNGLLLWTEYYQWIVWLVSVKTVHVRFFIYSIWYTKQYDLYSLCRSQHASVRYHTQNLSILTTFLKSTILQAKSKSVDPNNITDMKLTINLTSL